MLFRSPRSRLVKYPLLLREILKSTPSEHPDEDTLPDAVSPSKRNTHLHARTHTHTLSRFHSGFQLELIQSIVSEVDRKTGEAECQFYRRGLIYLEDGQRLSEIQLSRFLYCHGELKNTKGQVGLSPLLCSPLLSSPLFSSPLLPLCSLSLCSPFFSCSLLPPPLFSWMSLICVWMTAIVQIFNTHCLCVHACAYSQIAAARLPV